MEFSVVAGGEHPSRQKHQKPLKQVRVSSASHLDIDGHIQGSLGEQTQTVSPER